MSMTSGVFAWRKSQTREQHTAKNSGLVDRYPTHSRVVLPDGNIMLVRVASLAAAKDLLAAQRAAERKMAARREMRMMNEVDGIIEGMEQVESPLDGAR